MGIKVNGLPELPEAEIKKHKFVIGEEMPVEYFDGAYWIKGGSTWVVSFVEDPADSEKWKMLVWDDKNDNCVYDPGEGPKSLSILSGNEVSAAYTIGSVKVSSKDITVAAVQMYVDGDNDRLYDAPPLTGSEAKKDRELQYGDSAKMPGKIIVPNVDDDDGDGVADCMDETLESSSFFDDTARIVLRIPKWDESKTKVRLVVKDKTGLNYIRIFNTTGTKRELLLGPNHTDPYEFKVADIPDDNLVYLSVEGLSVLSPFRNTIELQYAIKDGSSSGPIIARDRIFLTVMEMWYSSTAFSMPFKFKRFEQHKDTGMICLEGCSRDSQAQHRWNHNHIRYAEWCNHCNSYCCRASIQMISYYFGWRGRIPSQDWIWRRAWKTGPLRAGNSRPLCPFK
ncbi:MAG: hypothetical protein JXR97_07490 [Planctomycetes bacterium]|nr:hypothetical protein [Planctomycetota bacterium]